MDVEKCHITHWPAPVLRKKAQAVEVIDDDIRRLVDRMKDVMIDQKGVGLAAPQIGVGLRVFIISEDGSMEGTQVFINPKVTTAGKLMSVEEGCLSVPGIYSSIRRYSKASVIAQDIDGNEFTKEGEGLFARALQHENDHLEGMTILSKLGPAAKIKHRRAIKRLEEEAGE